MFHRIMIALAPGGYAILSGLLTAQSGEVRAAYEAEGLVVHDTEEIGDWTTLCLRKSQ